MQANTDAIGDEKNIAWPVERVRSTFIDYFEKKQSHVSYKSSLVVPLNDPTLLFANAGMNQFKPIFLGTVDPNSPLADLRRAVNSQKCIRAGGKHNDLDDVGKDTYHHTFFEMLGTWSFGDYFKKEAIEWAWDILVNVYKLPKERLYASYFAGDEGQGLPCDTEARDMWLQFLPPERVLPFDKKANFWEMGETGPCGPCSEIHFDRIGGRDAAELVNADDPDVIEIWNLVFIQFNREPSGELRPLPSKHIDTGMGLERLTSILQDKRSNYDTDVFMPYFKEIQSIIGCPPYTGKLGKEDAAQNFRDTAYRVLADHVRTLTLAITDGATPSNEGRGYVLRRVLRRAVRFGIQTLGAEPGFFSKLVPVVARELGGAFPELKDKNAMVVGVVQEEEKAFSDLLERGVKYFEEMCGDMEKAGEGTVPGDKAFFLYDTMGFPIDLTQIMAGERGLHVDIAGFQGAMEAQKQRSRQATKEKRLSGRTALTLGAEQTDYLQNKLGVLPTEDSQKYQVLDLDLDDPSSSPPPHAAKVMAVFTIDGFVDTVAEGSGYDTVGVVLDRSPFYAESGGQAPDTGSIMIHSDGEVIELEVLDVQVYGGYVLHTCVRAQASKDGEDLSVSGISVGNGAQPSVDYIKRKKTAPNHTMTHLLNFALRKTLGSEVDQRGSSVTDERLRFDFSSSRGVRIDEIEDIQNIVNKVISEELPVSCQVVPLKEAMEINGLRAVFGEVYPDPVRVVSVGVPVGELLAEPKSERWTEYSIEFCGGTHLTNTREAQSFVITEEAGIAKGIRRISGLTGMSAVKSIEISKALQNDVLSLSQRIQSLVSKEESGEDASMLESESLSLRARLELGEPVALPYADKTSLRNTLEATSKDLSVVKNKQLMAMVDKGISLAREEAVRVSQSGAESAVLTMAIGSDAKAVKRATEEIKKAAPGLAFLGISADDEKILAFAFVPDEKVSVIKANEWVSKTLEPCGGKGGGKPNAAQGSAPTSGGDRERLKALAIQAAMSFTTK